MFDGERGRPHRPASDGIHRPRSSGDFTRMASQPPATAQGDDIDDGAAGKEAVGRLSLDAARGSGEYYYRRQVSKIRRDQEETKRMVKRQEQHYHNIRSLLEAATELVKQSPEMAAQILDDLLVEAQQGQDDVGILSRHVTGSIIQLAPGDTSL